jgi:AraC-like DNA-binding protein
MFSTTLNLFGLLALLSLCFCLIIVAVFLVHNKWSCLSNRMLFFALSSFAVACFLTFAIYNSAPEHGPGLGILLSGSTLLIMPFSYLYLQKWPSGTWCVTDYLHFTPVMGYLVLSLFGIIGRESVDGDTTVNGAFGIERLNYFLRAVQWFAYSGLMMYAYRSLVARASQSNFAKRPVWIKLFIGSFAITSVVPAVVGLQNSSSGEIMFNGFVIATAFVVCVYVLVNPTVLYGISSVVESVLSQDEFILQKVELKETPDQTNANEAEGTEADKLIAEETSKPKRISLSEEQIEFMNQRLHEFMFIRKPFLHPKYTLQQLSSDSGFPLYQLSLYLNRTLGMNFNSYINKMRIDFLLESYKRNQQKWNRYTLEAVAREIGFNNRTSFIQAFKKVTGTNPSVYFKNIHGHILKD